VTETVTDGAGKSYSELIQCQPDSDAACRLSR